MTNLKAFNLDTFIIVSYGIKGTNLFITDYGLLDSVSGKIYNRILNSGCYGYFINRKFKSESKLKKYPITKVITILEQLPF